MEQHIWGWLIVVYLFLGGLGAGAYLTSFAAEKGWLGNASSLTRAGYYIAAPVVAVGTGLLVLDLGQGLHKPWLLIGLLSNLRSVMTWGTIILSIFIVIGLIKAYFAWKQKEAPAVVSVFGALLALATGAYTGLLIADVQAIPFWSTMIMPILFVVSALSTGMSATVLLATIVEKGPKSEGRLNQAHLVVVFTEIIVAAIFFGTMISGTKGPIAAESAQMVMFGSFAIVFWILFVGLGLALPAIVYLSHMLKSKRVALRVPDAVPAAATSVTTGQHAATGEHANHSTMVLASDVAALVGGFALRYLIIFAALPVWNGTTI